MYNFEIHLLDETVKNIKGTGYVYDGGGNLMIYIFKDSKKPTGIFTKFHYIVVTETE